MNILIRNTSSTPIYEQIVSQIKAMIISGALQEGDALPSMRLLAKELRISVITTKRAYEELERDGFIFSVTGPLLHRLLRGELRPAAAAVAAPPSAGCAAGAAVSEFSPPSVGPGALESAGADESVL